MLLAIDIGTTNIKAGLFDESGAQKELTSRPNETRAHPDGFVCYDPEALAERVAAMIRTLTAERRGAKVRAIGITSMAESGLLVGRADGRPQSPIVPWFERCALAQARRIEAEADALERFRLTGVRPSPKYGLAKLLWLRERDPDALRGSVWLSVSAYIAYLLTGRFAEEHTLAARTYAFRIDSRGWDADWIRHFGLEEALFPPALPAGSAGGRVAPDAARALGLPPGVEVYPAGHDHVCASLAAGIGPEGVYNSMGTAETMVGTLAERPLTADDCASGLSFGVHPLEGRLFWMGGHSSSGGAIEWLRKLLGDDGLSYERVLELLDGADRGPGGVTFLPYLSGSGAPFPDPQATASFVGLTGRHGKADLIKAVLEGNACQMEAIRRCAEALAARPIREMRVVGGGTRNPYWLQLKADLSGVGLTVPETSEAALLGAALTAGVGCGAFASFGQASASREGRVAAVYEPDPARHAAYRRTYERFMRMREALRLE